MLYQWLIFLHIFGAIAFFYSHATPGLVAFRLLSERDTGRIETMISLYATNRVFGSQYGALLLLLVSGIINGFLGHWWRSGWIWLSLVLLIAITVAMYLIGTRFYSQVRKAVGMEYMQGNKTIEAGLPASPEELDALLRRSPAMLLFIIGFGGMALITWLMIFKPF
jgi:hypothetical protein